MKLGYFPGCSLHATGRELDESLKAIAGPLGVELVELDDWACCGATSAHATNHLLGVALPARTLSLAEKQGHRELLAPCAACYNRLASVRHELSHDASLATRVGQLLESPDFANSVRVLSIVELLRGLVPQIREKASQAMSGIKIACYYGCLLVRPPAVTGFDDAEAPTSMEEVVSAAGATPISWRMRLECCGGGFSLARTGTVIRLGRSILEDARLAGAAALVVACPMCHSNLDLRQTAMRRQGAEKLELPILYLSQLVGLALGANPVELGLGRHFVSTRSILERSAKAAAAAAGGGTA